ncbi:hypothetical protein [Treponema bryantii]|uniref:hypothetical protein n=1 Tax=Treponema bryantii TaxID=163 RepID=UPI0003B64E99|nr:hypothetical protein [Treponema bryantii]
MKKTIKLLGTVLIIALFFGCSSPTSSSSSTTKKTETDSNSTSDANSTSDTDTNSGTTVTTNGGTQDNGGSSSSYVFDESFLGKTYYLASLRKWVFDNDTETNADNEKYSYFTEYSYYDNNTPDNTEDDDWLAEKRYQYQYDGDIITYQITAILFMDPDNIGSGTKRLCSTSDIRRCFELMIPGAHEQSDFYYTREILKDGFIYQFSYKMTGDSNDYYAFKSYYEDEDDYVNPSWLLGSESSNISFFGGLLYLNKQADPYAYLISFNEASKTISGTYKYDYGDPAAAQDGETYRTAHNIPQTITLNYSITNTDGTVTLTLSKTDDFTAGYLGADSVSFDNNRIMRLYKTQPQY